MVVCKPSVTYFSIQYQKTGAGLLYSLEEVEPRLKKVVQGIFLCSMALSDDMFLIFPPKSNTDERCGLGPKRDRKLDKIKVNEYLFININNTSIYPMMYMPMIDNRIIVRERANYFYIETYHTVKTYIHQANHFNTRIAC